VQNTSSNGASDGDGQLEEQKTKVGLRNKNERGGKSGSMKNKDGSSRRSRNDTGDDVSNVVLDDEHYQTNHQRGELHVLCGLSLS